MGVVSSEQGFCVFLWLEVGRVNGPSTESRFRQGRRGPMDLPLMKVFRIGDGITALMFEAGSFRRADASWPWLEKPKRNPTPKRSPNRTSCRGTEASDLLGDDEAGPNLLDPDYLDCLAEHTKARFGKEG